MKWAMYEGHLATDPFQTVRFEGKGDGRSYAVPTDPEVLRLLALVGDDRLRALIPLCLLSGMRLGEASGLLREDIVTKGNLGAFILVRPNRLRKLKTRAAEREIPLHSALVRVLESLPKSGPLFPGVSVNMMAKAFAKLRDEAGLDHLVFHGTRKWFITRCERTGVREHFTVSLVGHKAARSGNVIYSDDQKRRVIDQIKLPT